MKKHFFLIALLSSVLFFSCKKKECEENGTGELRIISAIEKVMTVSIDDGTEFMIQPGEEYLTTIAEGVHIIEVTREVQGLPLTSSYGKDITACREGSLTVEF